MNQPAHAPSSPHAPTGCIPWTSATIGDDLELWRSGALAVRGTVEDRSADGSVIWMVDNLLPRRMFHLEDCYELLRPTLQNLT